MVVADVTLPFLSNQSKETDASFRLCGKTLERSDKEVLALANALAEQRARKQRQDRTKFEYSAKQHSPQVFVRRLKQDEIPSSPRTPRPPSLSAVSASIQSEMKSGGEVPADIKALDNFWEMKNAEQIQGLESFRNVAGCLDKDLTFYENRLPATHVEAWLSAVLARADTLDVLHRHVEKLRRSVGLNPPSRRHNPEEQCYTRESCGVEDRRGKSGFEEVDSTSHKKPQPVAINYQWLVNKTSNEKDSMRKGMIETNTENHRARNASIRRKYGADRLAQLALDRETLTALGLDQQTVDQTYRALYVHSVGAHMLVRRACGRCLLPQHRAGLSAALWIMFMYLVEGTEDVQYKSAISRTRMAGIENVEEAKELMKSEVSCNRDALHAATAQLRAANTCCEAFAADTACARIREDLLIQEREAACAQVVAEASAQYLKLLEKCSVHETRCSQVQASCAHYETLLKVSATTLETTRLHFGNTRDELDFVKQQHCDLETKYESAEIERQTLATRIIDIEAQLKTAVDECRSLRQEANREKSQRQAVESCYALLQRDINRVSKRYSNATVSCCLEVEKCKNCEMCHQVSSIPDAAISFLDIEVKHETSDALVREIRLYQHELLKLRDSWQKRAFPEKVDVALSPINFNAILSSSSPRKPRTSVRQERAIRMHRLKVPEPEHGKTTLATKDSPPHHGTSHMPTPSIRAVQEVSDVFADGSVVLSGKSGENSGEASIQEIDDVNLSGAGEASVEEGEDEAVLNDLGEANERMWKPCFNVTSDELFEIAAKETAAKLTSESWLRAYVESLQTEKVAKLLAEGLSHRLRMAETEALPASVAAFSAKSAREQSLNDELSAAYRSLESATNARKEAEERAHLAEAAPAEVGELIRLRTRNKVLQKAAVVLGAQLEQARDTARKSHRRELETQQTLNEESDKLNEMKRVEEERLKNVEKQARQEQTAYKCQILRLQEKNAALSEKLDNLAKFDLTKAKAREKAGAKLLKETVMKVDEILAVYASRAHVEAEDWRRRYEDETNRTLATDCTAPTSDTIKKTTKKPWPKKIVVIGGISQSINAEVLRPPIDLGISSLALEMALENFLDNESVDHARVCTFDATSFAQSCTKLGTASGQLAAPLPFPSNVVEASGKNNFLVDGDCQRSSDLDFVVAEDEYENLTTAAMAASSTLRRLERQLLLAQGEASSSNLARDSMCRQVSELTTRCNDLSSRCEALASAFEHSKRAHKMEIEKKDEHRRKLVMNARRLKEESDAETAKLADLLALTAEREEGVRKRLSFVSEIAQMASADSESRELRRWEVAFLSDVSNTVEEAIDAGKSLSYNVEEAGPYAAKVEETLSNENQNDDFGREQTDAISHQSFEPPLEFENDDASFSSAWSRPSIRKVQRKRPSQRPRRPTKSSDKGLRRRQKSVYKSPQFQQDDVCRSLEEDSNTVDDNTSVDDGRNTPSRSQGDSRLLERSSQLSMIKKIERATNEVWLRERHNAGLTQLWLSSQQHALVELRETCSRLTGLFEAARSKYMSAQTRGKKLSGALDRVTVAYNQLRKAYLDQLQEQKNRELEEEKNRGGTGDGAPMVGEDLRQKDEPRVEFGQDETTQTTMKLLCCRQMQTEHSWVHGCLKNQKAVHTSHRRDAEEMVWADTSPVVLATNARLIRMEEFHSDLFRESEDTQTQLLAKPQSILDEILQQHGFAPWSQGWESSPGVLPKDWNYDGHNGASAEGAVVEPNDMKDALSLEEPESSGISKADQVPPDENPGTSDEDVDEDKSTNTLKLSALKEASEKLRSGIGPSLHNLLMPHEDFAAEDVAGHRRALLEQQREDARQSALKPLELPPEVQYNDNDTQDEAMTQLEKVAFLDSALRLNDGTLSLSIENKAEKTRGNDQHLPPEIRSAIDLIAGYRAALTRADAVKGVSSNEATNSSIISIAQATNDALLEGIHINTDRVCDEPVLATDTTESNPSSSIVNEKFSTTDQFLLEISEDDGYSESSVKSTIVVKALRQPALASEDEVNAARRDFAAKRTHLASSSGDAGTPCRSSLACEGEASVVRDVGAKDVPHCSPVEETKDVEDADGKRAEAGDALNSDADGTRYAREDEEKRDAGGRKKDPVVARIRETIEAFRNQVTKGQDSEDFSSKRSEEQWNLGQIHLPNVLIEHVRASADVVTCISDWLQGSCRSDDNQIAYLKKVVRAATGKDLAVARDAQVALLTRVVRALEFSEATGAGSIHTPTANEGALLAKQFENERDALRRVHEEHYQEESAKEGQKRAELPVQYRIKSVEKRK